jgi:hypothetical protein
MRGSDGALPSIVCGLPLRAVRGLFPPMSTIKEIEAAADQLPPEQVRELVAYLTAKLEHPPQKRRDALYGRDTGKAYEVLTSSDGLPLIRGGGGVVTSARVREIEGLVP